MKYIINPYQDNWRPKCNYNTNIVPCCKTYKKLKNFYEKIN